MSALSCSRSPSTLLLGRLENLVCQRNAAAHKPSLRVVVEHRPEDVLAVSAGRASLRRVTHTTFHVKILIMNGAPHRVPVLR